MKLNLIALLAGVLILQSCATRQTGWDENNSNWQDQSIAAQSAITKAQVPATLQKADTFWGKRHEKTNLEKAIGHYHEVVKVDSDNYKAMVRLTRGYYLLADGHTKDIAEKKRYWEIGAKWGERAMATNADFKALVVDRKMKIAESLDVLTKKEVDAVYWTASNLGKWAKNSGIATTLKYKSRIKNMITTVGKLDPDYFHGAPNRYWGAYYALAPGFAGGDMNKSKESFERSIKIAPNYLGTQVLFADLYWRKVGDKEQFKKLLNKVLKADVNALPGTKSENIIEQQKARDLLAKMDELF